MKKLYIFNRGRFAGGIAKIVGGITVVLISPALLIAGVVGYFKFNAKLNQSINEVRTNPQFIVARENALSYLNANKDSDIYKIFPTRYNEDLNYINSTEFIIDYAKENNNELYNDLINNIVNFEVSKANTAVGAVGTATTLIASVVGPALHLDGIDSYRDHLDSMNAIVSSGIRDIKYSCFVLDGEKKKSSKKVKEESTEVDNIKK